MHDLLLVPGLLSDDYLWERQARDLSDVARVTLVPPPTADSVAGMAAAILDKAPDRFAVAGLSMGGYICFELWRQAAERIERLALVDTSARPDRPEQTELRRRLVATPADRFRLLTRDFVSGLITPQRAADEAFAGPLKEMTRRVGHAVYVAQQTAIMGRPDSRDILPAIDVPSLVVCGRQDITTPPDLAREMAELLPDSELVLIDDCAHMSPLEQPEAVTRALRDWLAR